jgi:hypothetical protein
MRGTLWLEGRVVEKLSTEHDEIMARRDIDSVELDGTRHDARIIVHDDPDGTITRWLIFNLNVMS